MTQNNLTKRYNPMVLRKMLNTIATLTNHPAALYENDEITFSSDLFVPTELGIDSSEHSEQTGNLVLRNYSSKYSDIIVPFEYDYTNKYFLAVRVSEKETELKDTHFELSEEMKNVIKHFRNFLNMLAEDALLTSELLNNMTVNSLQDHIIVVDRDLKITLANKSFEIYAAKTGWEPNEIVGTNIADVFPNIEKKYIDEYQKVFETGETVISELVSLLGGDIKVTEAHKIPIIRAGEAVGVLTVIRDVTKRRLAEIKLKDSETKYRQLYSEMNEGMALLEMIYDDNDKPVDFAIEDVNRAYEVLLGMDRESLIGKLGSEIYGGKVPYLKLADEVVKTGISQTFEQYVETINKYLLISCYSPTEGKFANIVHDITDTVKAEQKNITLIDELQSKSKETEQFTYAVSHDLKSPLITIKGFLGLIEDDLAAGNYKQMAEDLQRVSNASDKMTDLINDLLNLSRIGRVVNKPVTISINKLISEVTELLHGTISEKSVSIEVQENMPDLYADYTRVSEVFQNLIENSIKFSKEGSQPKIEISHTMKGEVPEFELRDYGIGIEREYFDKIFGMFEKLDSSYKGSGVGLSIVKRICELNGGCIKVDSKGLNEGAIFRFTFSDGKNRQTNDGAM